MSRTLKFLRMNRSAKASPIPELPIQAPEPDSTSQDESDTEDTIPFIEVSGSKMIDGSPDVLAFPGPGSNGIARSKCEPKSESGEDDSPLTISLWCSWTPRPDNWVG